MLVLTINRSIIILKDNILPIDLREGHSNSLRIYMYFPTAMLLTKQFYNVSR